MSTLTYTAKSVPVTDTIRFFHGDGPAQQFEAGHTIGGNYCCVGCGVATKSMDDIAQSYRSPKRTLQECQDLVLQGQAWKKGSTAPFDRLRIADLRSELSLRGIKTHGMKKPQLEAKLEEMRMGITNVPAILQNAPDESLASLSLSQYEIAPTEPLHDIKGHFSNLIEESIHIATGSAQVEIKKIRSTILNKDTLRGSDYRKAVILIYIKLRDNADQMLTDVYRTAVEIGHMLYAHDSKRTPRSILCLHNRAFVHAYLCGKLFASPHSITRRKCLVDTTIQLPPMLQFSFE